ncbi:cytidylyltransferase domain-containing protein [Shewanella dokdonensis]|uniref:NTP transferase domain-containing protein n=1 Tax=Shewanella dokdonensis TaxID=712036 RepID=A0ABX8DG98_9GAMM|nr:NTP transferase domain-containing protein [Shewanella dokdonensis]MCL1073988.1 NTP transferase domain-containing protein [Shewanella dokdonensis]QVK23747.1 NTP transferase domain-containing protein [Shewanella dokdonensis]
MNILAVVGARLNSSRLPGKHLLSLAGQPMIHHIFQRLQQCQQINTRVLATTADAFNQPLVDWAHSHAVEVMAYSGNVDDLVGRIDTVVQQYNADYIVYICGDCPLIEPAFIDHALTQLIAHPQKDSIKLTPGTETIHEGIAVYSHHGWQKLVAISTSDLAREHVGYGNKLTPVLDALEIGDCADFSKIKHRISVDTDADYRFMSEIYRRWYQHHGESTIVSLSWVQQQLLMDPQLRQINAHVHQKLPNVKYRKAVILCQVGADVGMGHLRRSVLLANALMEQLSIGVQLHIIGESRALPWLQANLAKWHTDITEALTVLKELNADLWIVDLHPAFVPQQQLIDFCCTAKANQQRIIAIDKCDFLLPHIDLLFVPSFFCELEHPNLSFGWENYLFTPQTATKKNQLLVLTGGSDALKYGAWLAETIDACVPADIERIWIQGPYAEAPQLPESSHWKKLQNPANLPTLVAESATIISCYGLSLFEAIASKALTILLPAKQLTSSNELRFLKQLQCCFICEHEQDIAPILRQVFNAKDTDTKQQILDNAAALTANIDGVNIFCKKIQAMFNGS